MEDGMIKEGSTVFRVVDETRMDYRLSNGNETLLFAKQKHTNFVVGDYVTRQGELLPRKSVIQKSKNQTSKTIHQKSGTKILAANVDVVFITIACDQRFSLGKLERYILVFDDADVTLKILLTKADYKQAAKKIQQQIKEVYPMMEVIQTSIMDDCLFEKMTTLIPQKSTIMFVGASGSGKTTLLNQLVDGVLFETATTQKNGKGKHTTTDTKLIYASKCDAYVIDTPGFKGIETQGKYHGDALFEELEKIATRCKFNDCQHRTEPGCAVLKAVEKGILSQKLVDRYQKYQRKLRR